MFIFRPKWKKGSMLNGFAASSPSITMQAPESGEHFLL